MTRAEFEQAAYLEEELHVLENRPGQQARVRELRSLLEEARAIPRRLPDPKARLVAQKVLEHGTPIPWKRIVAELGYRWTVGKARYAYSRRESCPFRIHLRRLIGGEIRRLSQVPSPTQEQCRELECMKREYARLLAPQGR